MQIQEMKEGMVITHLRPFVSPLVSPATLKNASLTIKVGSTFDSASFSRLLTNAGYVHTVSTSTMGEYSLRGEVLDIFPYESEYPYRLYADWDTVGKIARYNPTPRRASARQASSPSPWWMLQQSGNCSIGEYLSEDDLFASSVTRGLPPVFTVSKWKQKPLQTGISPRP
jgi:transcription-repair coupling factor (superfamily II helicase)